MHLKNEVTLTTGLLRRRTQSVVDVITPAFYTSVIGTERIAAAWLM
jgi:hypothetical protein